MLGRRTGRPAWHKSLKRSGKRVDENAIEGWRNRDAVAFLNRRADALAQRSADLKKLADAWQPLYRTLTPEQKQRMGALTIFVLRDMSDVVEQRQRTV